MKKYTQKIYYDDPFLSQIALESGFSDQSHMIRVFKRITGKTPTCFG